jgi:hypothetical protein
MYIMGRDKINDIANINVSPTIPNAPENNKNKRVGKNTIKSIITMINKSIVISI